MSLGRELRAWRAWTRRLPPAPKMLGLANHLARRAYVRRQRPSVTVDVLGARMTLDPHQHVDGLLLFAPHLVDRAERSFLAKHLPRGGTFLDAGAYLGFYSLQLASAVGPVGRVIAVEAHPTTATRLREHLDRNHLEWVQVETVALTDTEGEVQLVCADDRNAGSRHVVAGAGVASETLPHLMNRLAIARFDAVKTDLEGQDEAVVRDTLARLSPARWPRCWVIEAPAGDRRAPPEVAKSLARAGYRTRRLSRLNIGAWLD